MGAWIQAAWRLAILSLLRGKLISIMMRMSFNFVCAILRYRSKRRSTMPIKNLLLAVSVIAGLGNIAGIAYADNKIDASDLPAALYGGALLVPKLIEIDWSALVPEAKDLSIEEQAQLIAHFKAEFNIPQEDLEVTIEEVLQDVTDGIALVRRVITRFRRKVTV
jgi:hypothetical protein